MEAELLQELDSYLETSHFGDQTDGNCWSSCLVRILIIAKQLLREHLQIHSAEEIQLNQICETLTKIIKITAKIHNLLSKKYKNDVEHGTF